MPRINFSNSMFYAFIIIIFLIFLNFAVYAYGFPFYSKDPIIESDVPSYGEKTDQIDGEKSYFDEKSDEKNDGNISNIFYEKAEKTQNFCFPLVQIGTPGKKIDVVFIGDSYTTEAEFNFFVSSLPGLIGISDGSRGILSREPFSSNADRFNFYYLNKSEDWGCAYDLDICVDIAAENCPFFDHAILLMNRDTYGGSGRNLELAWTYMSMPEGIIISNPLTIQTIISHEYGHTFGLGDEYRSIGVDSNRYPNLDVLGCPRWCGGVPLFPDNECSRLPNEADCFNTLGSCDWSDEYNACFSLNVSIDYGQECIENSGCYPFGIRGLFHSSLKSMMSDMMSDFNEVSIRHINNVFRCCYPQNAEEFDAELCTQWK